MDDLATNKNGLLVFASHWNFGCHQKHPQCSASIAELAKMGDLQGVLTCGGSSGRSTNPTFQSLRVLTEAARDNVLRQAPTVTAFRFSGVHKSMVSPGSSSGKGFLFLIGVVSILMISAFKTSLLLVLEGLTSKVDTVARKICCHVWLSCTSTPKSAISCLISSAPCATFCCVKSTRWCPNSKQISDQTPQLPSPGTSNACAPSSQSFSRLNLSISTSLLRDDSKISLPVELHPCKPFSKSFKEHLSFSRLSRYFGHAPLANKDSVVQAGT